MKQEVLWCAKPKPTFTDFTSSASGCRKSPHVHTVVSHGEETCTSSHKRSRGVTPAWLEPTASERKDVVEQPRSKRESVARHF